MFAAIVRFLIASVSAADRWTGTLSKAELQYEADPLGQPAGTKGSSGSDRGCLHQSGITGLPTNGGNWQL